jgi:anti-sigma regulatory factor (Ser/Thr protein kinase)/DNA-binding NarL/FixJ family response regulator
MTSMTLAIETEQTLAVRPASVQSTVLLLEADDYVRDALETYLTQFYKGPLQLNMKVASHVKQAQALLQSEPVDLLLCDLASAQEEEQNLLDWVLQHKPSLKTAVFTSRPLEDSIKTFREKQVATVLIKQIPFHLEELAMTLEHLLIPETAFGLRRYLGSAAQIQRTRLVNTHQVGEIFQVLGKFLGDFNVTQCNEILTVLIEAITNAIYHAPVDALGNEKYEKGQVIEKLEDGEVVTVSYGHSPMGQLGISVQDQWGRLDKEGLLYWLERNMTGSNILDLSGRGLFLMYSLADRLYINVESGKLTEIIFIHHLQERENLIKPLYLQVK